MRAIAFSALNIGIFAAGLQAANPEKVTFHKDVAPVLQRNCQSCHRPGEAAPMSLLTYREARPWAKAIKQAVASKKMPPWFAEAGFGQKFHNDPTMTAAEIASLAAWADQGAPEGNPKDSPAPLAFADGWRIGKPDRVFEMPQAFSVPASGTVAYQYVVLPTGFTEDKWVTAAEARPGNRAINHHIIAFVREPGSKWLAGAEPGKIFTPDQLPRQPGQRQAPQGLFGAEFLIGYAPGAMAEVMQPGQAKLIPAGSDIILQLHYTANGTAGEDKSKIGLVFAKEPPKERVMTLAAFNPRFAIPPGADNHQVEASMTLQGDAKLLSLIPHMHNRGKAFEMRLAQPDGAKTDLLRMRWDFNWQLSYVLPEPIALTRGSKIEATAWFDNSANNPYNPDPKKEVRWGDQSWEEMMIGFFSVSFDAKKDPMELMRAPKRPEASSGAIE